MTDEGYDIGNSAINYGISVIKDLVEKDPDFRIIIHKLSKVD